MPTLASIFGLAPLVPEIRRIVGIFRKLLISRRLNISASSGGFAHSILRSSRLARLHCPVAGCGGGADAWLIIGLVERGAAALVVSVA